MIIKEVVQIGNPILSRKSKPVIKIDAKETKRVIKNLADSMRFYELVGMAAPQIGDNTRIFVTELRKTKNRKSGMDPLRVYINPKITWSSKEQVVIYEGCGSVAYSKLFAPVRRPERVTIEAYDEKGKKFKLEAGGMLARVIQHEYDHLDGISFTEKINDIRKIMSDGEYRKMIVEKK